MDERYSRQSILPELGADGQRKLREGKVLLVGCGALGTHQAELLVRAGVGTLRIVDRDFVELSNLPRQGLFDEADAAAHLPKAEAAARRLRAMNSEAAVEPVVGDVSRRNVEALLSGMDLALDATDNLETRYLLNDACVKHVVPWVYGGAIGTEGTVMVVRPGTGPCLRCLLPEAPPAGLLPTCDQRGVLNTAPALVAALQVTAAFKLLVGAPGTAEEQSGKVRPAEDRPTEKHGAEVLSVDVWAPQLQAMRLKRDPSCPCCGKREFRYLSGSSASDAVRMCGRNAVQITPARESAIPLAELQGRLSAVGTTVNNGYFLKLIVEPYELVIFPDGRTMVRGTTDESLARTLYARYVGA